MKNNLADFSATSKEANDWKWQLKYRIKTISELEKYIVLSEEEKKGIERLKDHNLPMAITPYFLSIMDKKDPLCPIRKQVIPHLNELTFNKWERSDPCGEEKDSPVPFLVHRYPDRVLVIATQECDAYCRDCTRQRLDQRERDFKIDFN